MSDRHGLLRQAVQRERSEAVRRSRMTSAAKYESGYQSGYTLGVMEGQRAFAAQFEGTSIIIPTYNQKELLLRCISGIEAHTELPYEIIIVDDGSTDGTREALRKRRGSFRVGFHQKNLGFASAINTGLMMAKGSTIVLLNNDVLVTERWLSQMLIALNNSSAAAVGPVTNYISGAQQIDTAYNSLREMERFAAKHNVSDSLKWRYTDRLVGFCLLFPRDVFEEVGYFDEGYEIGNFEDDDWILRLQLQGKRLMIAGDTFVHHIGSVTMKSLGQEGFAAVNDRNEQFFYKKWGNPFELLQEVKQQKGALRNKRSSDFFPTHIWVEGGSGKRFWLENGLKFSFSDTINEKMPDKPVRLSVIDLIQIPTGIQRPNNGFIYTEGARLRDGMVLRTNNGTWYQLDRGKLRKIASDYACELWGLMRMEPKMITFKEMEQYEEGPPILPPPVLRSEDL
ncbi:glycosyltransferase family 2 protein [Paenibacillus fonticola]|uniref:glycosyltransferase family 2 protein n=1 Tax=Paenibacillus fonticola TaxID=379896 RepID=UPI000362D568|nr:glycosyltransferase family 2 protein [Paenibacillus fonticola]